MSITSMVTTSSQLIIIIRPSFQIAVSFACKDPPLAKGTAMTDQVLRSERLVDFVCWHEASTENDLRNTKEKHGSDNGL